MTDTPPPASGESPSVALVEACLARIDEVDALVDAVCTPNPHALVEAARLDAERAAGRSRGPLHGVPVLVKDNVDTADLPTTAGSLALAGLPPPAQDAPVVRRLREAGCVLLGKTNLSEWANFRNTVSVSGWSGSGGLTRNPYALNRSAGGSSSGSGAAIAAGMARFAVGTETDGSIVCPAALNGVVGIKPTVGLLPQHGIVPIAASQDTAGPMAATVREAAALLGVLAADGTDYAAGCGPDGDAGALAGVRLGVPRHALWGYSAGLDEVSERALALLARAGATIVDPVDLPALSHEDERTVLCHEFKVGLEAYLATRTAGRDGAAPRTLADVIAFNRAHADAELRYFGQDLFERADETGGLHEAAYVAARVACLRAGRDGIDDALRQHRLDALVMPAYSPAWSIDLVNGDHYLGGCSMHAALAGYPLVAVPSGLVGGLPVAICFGGTAHSDATLVRLAHAFEQARIEAHGPFPEPEFTPWV